MKRYFMDRDDSGHRYFIEWEKREQWSEWLDIPSEDEMAWDVPDYARSIDGGTLTFTDPQIL